MPIYEYYCELCQERSDTICSFKDKPTEIPCKKCGKPAESCMSKPGHFRVAIEGQGRKGYKIDMGDRRKVVRSATREQYEHNIGNKSAKAVKEGGVAGQTKSVYTKEYQRKVEGDAKLKQQKFIHDFKKRTEK